MAERDSRERDILVASNEYVYVQDLTKGDIVLYVGPTKISLSNTERLVELKNERFTPTRGDDGNGVQPFVTASSAQYVVLENPAKDATVKPVKGNNSAVELLVGRRVVVPGPAVVFPEAWEEFVVKNGVRVFAAWPLRRDRGLHVRVLQGFEAKAGDQVPPGRYEAGQELFVHAREGYFFPTEALEVLGEVAAVQLAAKEAVYLRDLQTGAVRTVEGPLALLPDPTQVERVTRPLDAETARRWGLGKVDPSRAPTITVPPGEAVLVTGTPSREVVRGPAVRVLAFDETLETLTLKTLGDQHFAASLTENLSPLAILGGESVADVARRLLSGLPTAAPNNLLPLPRGGEGRGEG